MLFTVISSEIMNPKKEMVNNLFVCLASCYKEKTATHNLLLLSSNLDPLGQGNAATELFRLMKDHDLDVMMIQMGLVTKLHDNPLEWLEISSNVITVIVLLPSPPP